MKFARLQKLALTLVIIITARTTHGLEVLIGRNLASVQPAQIEASSDARKIHSMQLKLEQLSNVLLPSVQDVTFDSENKAEISLCITAEHGNELFTLSIIEESVLEGAEGSVLEESVKPFSENRSNVSRYDLSGVFVDSILFKSSVEHSYLGQSTLMRESFHGEPQVLSKSCSLADTIILSVERSKDKFMQNAGMVTLVIAAE